MPKKRVVILDVVGLSPAHFNKPENLPNLAALRNSGSFHELVPPFPALTLPVQASLTTGSWPERHGIVANGFYFPETMQISLWEQADSLVQSERIWERLKRRRPELTTALLFMQNSLYADCEVVITPKPIHSETELIPWCYSKPVGYYEEICRSQGEFPLFNYWGPMAGIASSRWIAGAAIHTLEKVRPDLMFVYLPHLDYCSQKSGQAGSEFEAELRRVDGEVGRIVSALNELGLREETVILLLSEYAFQPVTEAVPINRILRRHDLLRVRTIRGREYLDMEMSAAFAMVDHQVAHLYITPGCEEAVRKVLEREEGIDLVLQSGDEKKKYRINHPRSGDIVAVSRRERWFSYYWWEDEDKAPDFADRVDIHRKPGYDPLELFMDPGTRTISRDTRLIRGSHGYPPQGPGDMVPLIINDNGKPDFRFPVADRLDMNAVPALIEKILCE